MTAPARTRRLVVVGASLAGLRVVEGPGTPDSTAS